MERQENSGEPIQSAAGRGSLVLGRASTRRARQGRQTSRQPSYTAGVELHEYVQRPDEELDLLQGALLIARDAYPGLDVARYASEIDRLAAAVRGRALRGLPLERQAAVLSEHLYGHCKFRGNSEDYYDPRNSFLNDVLDRRLGIPITLAIVYVEVARRVGVRASGVAFPGHFLVRLDRPEEGPLFIDPFGGGALLDHEALQELLRRAAGPDKTLEPSHLRAASVRSILVRMLMNLRAIYATRGEYAQLLVVLDRIIDLVPDASTELRDRGLLWAKLGAPQAAIADLRGYLAAHPGEDADQVRRLLSHLERARSAKPN